MMNFKSTLWALAFACVAVSCSDDVDDGLDNSEADSKGGYFMTVNIATGGGSSLTKASSNGEGDDYLDDEESEAKVYDVNVFLINSSAYTGTGTDTDLLGLLNMENASSVNIAGQGYTSIENGLIPGGGTEPNHDKVEVEMQLTEPIPGETSQTYQVFTVVNAGKKLSGITTLAQLRDFEYTNENGQNPVWSGTVASANKFVMSTHKMTGIPGNSVVTLSAENMDASNPAVTNVYVERLAARIDLKVAEGLLNTGYESENATIGQNGTFKLTGYTVVNRWNGESYLFKQVSPTVTGWADALPEVTTTYGENDPKKYLGDEVWNESDNSAHTGSFNYVVEPKTRSKTGTDWLTTSYLNPFKEDGNLNTIASDNSEWVTDMSSINSSTFSKIAYTKENTMTVKMQKNGYSTGVIFESEFMPGDNFKVSKYSEGSIAEATLSGDKTFLVANHQKGTSTQKVVYADVKTIAAMAFDGIGTSMTVDMYKGFMDGDWPTTDPELSTIQGLIAQMKESNKVEAAFKKYLSGIANADGADWATVKGNLTYAKFLESDTDGKKLAITGDVTADYIGTLFEDFGISYYNGGKSYHKFWIRHDNNGNNNVMGVMEFCIVRNNVYQLDVTGVRDLGDPLPYTPGKDDPDNPDESGEVSILVNIYVKNWVVRSNGGIIL